MAGVVLPRCLQPLEQRLLTLQVPLPHRTLLISATWGHSAPLQEQGSRKHRVTQSNIRFISKENKQIKSQYNNLSIIHVLS